MLAARFLALQREEQRVVAPCAVPWVFLVIIYHYFVEHEQRVNVAGPYPENCLFPLVQSLLYFWGNRFFLELKKFFTRREEEFFWGKGCEFLQVKVLVCESLKAGCAVLLHCGNENLHFLLQALEELLELSAVHFVEQFPT